MCRLTCALTEGSRARWKIKVMQSWQSWQSNQFFLCQCFATFQDMQDLSNLECFSNLFSGFMQLKQKSIMNFYDKQRWTKLQSLTTTAVCCLFRAVIKRQVIKATISQTFIETAISWMIQLQPAPFTGWLHCMPDSSLHHCSFLHYLFHFTSVSLIRMMSKTNNLYFWLRQGCRDWFGGDWECLVGLPRQDPWKGGNVCLPSMQWKNGSRVD